MSVRESVRSESAVVSKSARTGKKQGSKVLSRKFILDRWSSPRHVTRLKRRVIRGTRPRNIVTLLQRSMAHDLRKEESLDLLISGDLPVNPASSSADVVTTPEGMRGGQQEEDPAEHRSDMFSCPLALVSLSHNSLLDIASISQVKTTHPSSTTAQRTALQQLPHSSKVLR